MAPTATLLEGAAFLLAFLVPLLGGAWCLWVAATLRREGPHTDDITTATGLVLTWAWVAFAWAGVMASPFLMGLGRVLRSLGPSAEPAPLEASWTTAAASAFRVLDPVILTVVCLLALAAATPAWRAVSERERRDPAWTTWTLQLACLYALPFATYTALLAMGVLPAIFPTQLTAVLTIITLACIGWALATPLGMAVHLARQRGLADPLVHWHLLPPLVLEVLVLTAALAALLPLLLETLLLFVLAPAALWIAWPAWLLSLAHRDPSPAARDDLSVEGDEASEGPLTGASPT